MPIRMVDDPQDSRDDNDDSGGGGSGFDPGGGGGGGLFGLLLLLLGLFRGRGLIIVLLLLAGGYFFFGRGGCNTGRRTHTKCRPAALFTGGFLDPRQFEKADIYESLCDDFDKKTRFPKRPICKNMLLLSATRVPGQLCRLEQRLCRPYHRGGSTRQAPTPTACGSAPLFSITRSVWTTATARISSVPWNS